MKKILYFVLPLTLAVAIAAGAAFSAWRFETVGGTDNRLENIRDDIFENYDIKSAADAQSNRVSTYEMYLYPSTLYLNDYVGCLGNSNNILPEEKYGYIEPKIDINGNVTYNVVDKGGDAAYLSDIVSNKTYTMSSASDVTAMYCNVYLKNEEWNKTENNGLSGDIAVGNTSVAANSKYLYGDPELDKTALTYDYSDEQHNWRNLHFFDRFGYWPNLANGSGRYLPLKITVDENFSNTYYDKVALSPFADMGDPKDWYVYSFACWAYVSFGSDGEYTLPYYATAEFAKANSGTKYVNSDGSANPSLGSFCPTMVNQYFDIIESFEKYADSKGVIRLFPKFSNGKGYNAGTVKDGGGDAIKAVPELKDEYGNQVKNTPLDQHELHMFYSTETGSVTSDSGKAAVHVSVLPNIDIDSYYSLSFKFASATYMAGWQGDWQEVYLLGRGVSSDDNKNIPETLKSYGYGLYNLYLFITDVATTGTGDYTEQLEAMRQSLVNKKSDSGTFPSLFGKNLLPIAKSYVGGKSFMLVAEKVREAKFIGDVNFGDTRYTTEEEIEAKYLSATKSFRLINKDLDGYNGSVKTEKINSNYPYCYILQNVDFTEATTQYCQIRFQRNYRADLHFTEDYAYDRIGFSNTIYEQGFGNYFELVNDEKVYSADGVSEQQVIKLSSEEMRGVYDIILVFRSARETDPESDVAYNIGLYAFRHTNIFLKIFENNPSDTVKYYETADGAVKVGEGETVDGSVKTYEFIDHSAAALFVKSYPIGVSVKNTDENDGSIYAKGTSLAKCVNSAVAGKDPSGIKLIDHVTGAEVASYREIADAGDNSQGLYLLYEGKYYELVFNPFKIRKNYIFYISYGS